MEIGQKLYFVPRQRTGNPDWVTITKVGRKWVETDWRDIRLNKETLAADGRGYTSPGCAYYSKELYEREAKLGAAWSKFRIGVSNMYSMPDGMTLETVERCASHLGIKI